VKSPANILKSRWWIVFLLFSGTLVNAFERGSISTAATTMMKDLHIDPALMGVVLSSFFWAYLVMNIPAGILADKFGPKITLGISAVVWSVFSTLTGLAAQSWQLILFRIGVGTGEAATNPVNTKVIKNSFNSAERGLAAGWYLSGFRLGFAAAPVVMAYLIQAYDWRFAFIITGIASLGWAALWYFTFKEAKKEPEAAAQMPEKIPWRKLLRHRNIVGLALCKFFQDYSYYLFVTWLPTYLIKERGFTLIKSGWSAALPWVIACSLQPVAGWFSDYLIKRGVSTTASRKICIIVMQVLAAVVVLAGYVDSAVVAVWLLAMSLTCESASSVILWAVCAEVAPTKASASVGGLMNTAGAFAGIVAPILTGLLLKYTGNFQLALLVGGCMFVGAALSMGLVVGKVEAISLDDPPPMGDKFPSQREKKALTG
jgi:MFS family permease